MITFENALEIVDQLSIEQQEMLIDIIQKRHAEMRRREIIQECREALTEYREGNLKALTAEEAIADLWMKSIDRPDVVPRAIEISSQRILGNRLLNPQQKSPTDRHNCQS